MQRGVINACSKQLKKYDNVPYNLPLVELNVPSGLLIEPQTFSVHSPEE